MARKLLPAVVVGALGVLLSVGGFAVVRHWETNRFQLELDKWAAAYAQTLSAKLSQYTEELESVVSLYAASASVDRQGFRAFTRAILDRYPEFQAIEWIPRVRSGQRAAYEDRARRDGHAGFRFTERSAAGDLVAAQARPQYYPILYLEPAAGNETALGFDLGSDPERLAFLIRARVGGRAVVSGRVRLAPETRDGYGFLIVFPVYRSGLAHATTEQRRRNLLGFVLGALPIGDVVESALAHMDGARDIDITLFDAGADPSRPLFHRSRPGADPLADPRRLHKGFYADVPVTVGDRDWTAVVKPSASALAARRGRGTPLFVLFFGLALTGLLTVYLVQQLRRAEIIESNVAHRTRELAEREERLRAILDSAVDGIITIDESGTIESFNRAAERIFGYGSDEILRANVRRLMPEPYRAAHDGYLAHYLETGEKRIIGSGREVEGRRKDGTTFPIELAVSEVVVQGRRKFVGIVRDITERKTSEEALAEAKRRNDLILEAAGEGIYGVDLDGRTTFINPAAARMTGWEPGDLIGEGQHEILHHTRPDGTPYPREECPIYLAFRDGEVHHVADEVFWRKDGTSFPVEYVSTPMRDGARVTGAVVVFRDITERKQMEKMKNEFVSTVSHELRTPLTSIQASLALIANAEPQGLAAKHRKLLGIAHKNCGRLVRLINDILDIEKIESGRMEFSLAAHDLMALVEQAIEANQSFARMHSATLVLKKSLPGARVYVDPDRMAQVLANLMSNAAKYSPEGGVVEVAVTRRSGGVRVSVTDSGEGIPADFRDRIFEKFAQADSSTTRKTQGTGLGLNIAKAIVEKMGGELGFTTEAGVGTTFYFDLPEWRSASPAAPAEDAPAGASSVLVCEDNADVALLMRMMLAEEGITCDVAPTIAEARELLAARAYSAMTLDLTLPDGDGMSLVGELDGHEVNGALPVIVVSAMPPNGGNDLAGEGDRIFDWLPKPIERARLVAAVNRARANGRKPRILYVEDDADTVEWMATALGEIAELEPSGSIEDAETKLKRADYDLLLLGVALPDGDGADAIRRLRGGRGRAIPVVLFTVDDNSENVARNVEAVLIKSRTHMDHLVDTLNHVLGRDAPARGEDAEPYLGRA